MIKIEIKCIINVMCLNHPKVIWDVMTAPTPCPVCGKIVFHIHDRSLDPKRLWTTEVDSFSLPSSLLFKILFCSLFRTRQWQPTPVLLPGKSHGWRSLVGCSPWGHKELTQLSNFTFTFHFHALEKEMATHSSILAWRIPGTAEPGGLPSMGSQSWTRLKRLSSSSILYSVLAVYRK